MKITRQNISEHLFEYQLSLIGKSVKDAIGIDWRKEWYITPEKSEEFSKYAIPLLKKIFKCSKSKATSTFEWFLLNFGLYVKR